MIWPLGTRLQPPRGGFMQYKLPLADRIARLHRKPGIDVHVADHCNLRRRGCVHFAPIAEPRFPLAESL